jgi:hypothetical protein
LCYRLSKINREILLGLSGKRNNCERSLEIEEVKSLWRGKLTAPDFGHHVGRLSGSEVPAGVDSEGLLVGLDRPCK